jgi:hypothetical protein
MPFAAHAWQVPVQGTSQHTPPAQAPDAHSAAWVHALPRGRRANSSALAIGIQVKKVRVPPVTKTMPLASVLDV